MGKIAIHNDLWLLYYLALTIVIEGAVIAILYRRLDYIYYSALCNLLTNPLLNFTLLIIVKFWSKGYYLAMSMLEIAVVLSEAYILKLLCRFRLARTLTVSVLMNTISFLLGYIILHLL